jgi:hypothetical protein
MSDELIALAKLVAHQAYVLNFAVLQLADQAVLIERLLLRCEKCQELPCTVEHRYVHVKFCDRCAAESIVNSGRAYVNGYAADPRDPFNDVRSSLMIENDWIDILDAEKVRHVVDYANSIKEFKPDQVH